MRPYEYLRRMREPIPRWLDEFAYGESIERQRFFSFRIVYYPGSETDAHFVMVFDSTSSAHSFVYVDYGSFKADLEAELGRAESYFRCCHTLGRIEFSEHDLARRSNSSESEAKGR